MAGHGGRGAATSAPTPPATSDGQRGAVGTAGHGSQAASGMQLNYFTINGKSHPATEPIRVN